MEELSATGYRHGRKNTPSMGEPDGKLASTLTLLPEAENFSVHPEPSKMDSAATCSPDLEEEEENEQTNKNII